MYFLSSERHEKVNLSTADHIDLHLGWYAYDYRFDNVKDTVNKY